MHQNFEDYWMKEEYRRLTWETSSLKKELDKTGEALKKIYTLLLERPEEECKEIKNLCESALMRMGKLH